MEQQIISEKNIHRTFEISIILKGVHAIFEIIGGVLVFFTSKAYLLSTIALITAEETGEDPKDFIVHYLVKTANEFSVSTQHFVSLYLLSHGVIKLVLVIGLLKEKMWAYPASIAVFSFFIIYQIQRYTTTHSFWLLLLTLLDAFIIFLTWHEYKLMRQHKPLE